MYVCMMIRYKRQIRYFFICVQSIKQLQVKQINPKLIIYHKVHYNHQQSISPYQQTMQTPQIVPDPAQVLSTPTFIQWIFIALIFYFIAITLNYLLTILWDIAKNLWPQNDLQKEYSHKDKQSWAVVTGATDGIGLGFCQQLVTKGFNVCLISRNANKINTVIQRLHKLRPQKYSTKKIAGIQFDFTQIQDNQKLTDLLNQLDKMHITLLINNVGVALIKDYIHCQYQQVVDVISVNCTTMAVLNNYFVKKVQEIKKSDKSPGKYAIINLSSLAGHNPIPYISIYSSTKAFNKFISEGLSIEYPNIDILSIHPMHVESGGSNVKKQFNIPTSRQCARDSLKQLKFKTYSSPGYLSHCITGTALLTFLPKWFLRIVSRVEMKNLVEKYYTKKQ